MSRHEGVSCDSCSKGNFRGKRFKCLICYDYDLCATCYENGATTTRHTADHPMQCILTRADFELYYGGEAFTPDQPQAFTCPYCGKLGLTELLLQEHVSAEHADSSIEVVCPVCAALPGGDPNHVTDDFAAHLTLEHRAPRDSIYDEPGTARHVRRMFHPSRGIGVPRPRSRAGNMHFGTSSSATPASSSSSSSNRESMDPIAELLSQLSGVRRAAQQAQQAQQPVQSQLQLLQQQLQLERQQVQQTRERLERLPRRQMAASTPASTVPVTTEVSSSNSSFLLSRANEPALTEKEQEELENQRTERSLFVQDLILSTLGSGTFRKSGSSFCRDASAGLIDEFSQLLIKSCQSEADTSEGGGSESVDVPPVPITVTAESVPELNQDIEIISLEMDDDDDDDDEDEDEDDDKDS